MIQDFSYSTTPSFPQAFGGNPGMIAGLDSRQKLAGMTIGRSERICISWHGSKQGDTSIVIPAIF
jgi:hypothetical protein